MADDAQAPWQQGLLRAWRGRGPLVWLLWPLSLVFGALAGWRRMLYRAGILRSRKVASLVVVVGNVVAGGGGKTPVVMALLAHLRARGLHCGVVSRGYGRSSEDACREALADSLPVEVGDEPALIRRKCAVPVFVARERADAALALLARYPQTQIIIGDDGLQHYALQRDIEICVFDAHGIGNGLLLPAGPLREPWPRATNFVLRSADADPALGGFRAGRSLAGFALHADGSQVPLQQLQGRPIAAVAAIAQPEAFFAMLRAQGLQLAHTLALPDHHNFAPWSWPAAVGHVLLCTEKDAVKLWPLNPQALAVPLELQLDADFLREFDRLVDAKLSSPHGHQTA